MKKIIYLWLTVLFSFHGFSQEITGEWHGSLKIQGTELPLVFHIEKTGTGYRSKLDSPQQGAFGIPMNSTLFKNDTLKINSEMGISYRGVYTSEKEIVGHFKQNGLRFPLRLTRKKEKANKAPAKRPQDPEKPYPYISKEVSFKNKQAGITLAGTLTLPKEKGKFPAVVLISGSGPQNRNEELMNHRPFLVLSDYLTRNGIAVLRYDDRGTAESEGNFHSATTADFATDTKAAIHYLLSRKEIDPSKIGLIGHSEGGVIAPMVAAKSDTVAFLVLMAASGVPGDELLVMQNRAWGKASGMNALQLDIAEHTNRKIYEMMKNTPADSLENTLTKYIRENMPGLPEKQIKQQVKVMSSDWMLFFLRYDPATALEKTNIPVLAINGENDLQVPAEINLKAIETALKKGGNTDITTKTLPGLNHLFQESKTGLPSEYAKIKQTFSPKALEIIVNWIKEQTH